MAGFIRNLKNPFTGNYIFPVTKTRAIYDDYGNRLDNYLNSLYGSPSSNLLINSNFANPINQRGVTFPYATANTYFIDRWFVNEYATVSKTSKGLKITSNDLGVAIIRQIVEDDLVSHYITASAKIDDKVMKVTWKVEANKEVQVQKGNATLNISHDGSHVMLKIASAVGTSIEVEWAKLEYGEASTPYAPRLYAEELQLCKRYYRIISLIDIVYAYTTDLVYVRYTIGDSRFGMREVPTVSILSSIVYKNGSHDQGFNFSVFIITASDLVLKGEKTAHGLTISNVLQVYSLLALDAEL